MDEDVLETGVYCRNCGFFETPDYDGDHCNGCGCAESNHVAAQVVIRR